MELLHTFLNLVSFSLGFLFLGFVMPPYIAFKLLNFISSFFSEEDVAGKVILITGASSGIGEHMAYSYARRGACLALAARREDRLQEVANRTKKLGSPKLLIIVADVSKVDDCKRMIDATINHFGRVDLLVNNAGVPAVNHLEDPDITRSKSVMEINFWGSVYTTKFAIPHLRKSKGRIIAISSCCGWFPHPDSIFYNASKAAMIHFFETLKFKVAPDIKITVVCPGYVHSEMTQKSAKHVLNSIIGCLVYDTDACAETIVKGACRGRKYMMVPAWSTHVGEGMIELNGVIGPAKCLAGACVNSGRRRK
ncbi:11-beta-hydroxysteroid dehydrogenase 1B-like protein [Drosera capensis]